MNSPNIQALVRPLYTQRPSERLWKKLTHTLHSKSASRGQWYCSRTFYGSARPNPEKGRFVRTLVNGYLYAVCAVVFTRLECIRLYSRTAMSFETTVCRGRHYRGVYRRQSRPLSTRFQPNVNKLKSFMKILETHLLLLSVSISFQKCLWFFSSFIILRFIGDLVFL